MGISQNANWFYDHSLSLTSRQVVRFHLFKTVGRDGKNLSSIYSSFTASVSENWFRIERSRLNEQWASRRWSHSSYLNWWNILIRCVSLRLGDTDSQHNILLCIIGRLFDVKRKEDAPKVGYFLPHEPTCDKMMITICLRSAVNVF